MEANKGQKFKAAFSCTNANLIQKSNYFRVKNGLLQRICLDLKW